MPYTINERGGTFDVVKRNDATGHVYGTHATKADAEAQIRAIEAGEHERKPWTHHRLW